MVETTCKTKTNLIDAINKIKAKYENDGLIISFYRDVYALNDDISDNVSSQLYDDFKTELRCVYYESLYGDGGEYTDRVIADCMNVLSSMVDELTFF
jgi:hypothetical protein